MISIDNQELFEKYYQKEYDFNTSSLTEEEVDEIKELAKEKRVNYALAPIGRKIFEWIREQNANLHFEFVDFQSEKIDGMLYVPESGADKAYIILNSNKPLINQIFATAHEYYHYVKDYMQIKEEPFVCNFNNLMSINEKRASRFAAEFLLPEEALRNEIKFHHKRLKNAGLEIDPFTEYSSIAVILTIKYEMPLKAVIYRLYEEGYIDDISRYIADYNFLKSLSKEMKFFREKAERLYSNRNDFFNDQDVIYRQMEKVYLTGYAARTEIINDAEKLGLNLTTIQSFFDRIEEDDEEDDEEMLACLEDIWEGRK
ncbi:MAG: ImmA/IrrE family metallo-endopeptidase [Lachnospiraceae bacterium]|nr:ImmA/IrrE family metallo-endopeptidase [Lachnospiraceae bacterium]